MTPPPRLAPLETMTESELGTAAGELRHTDNEGAVWSRAWLDLVLKELEAQRLARARERDNVWQAALESVMAGRLEGDVQIVVTMDVVQRNCAALRDQEEA